jgi:16S rRNA (adenine1518-N6/adenine1519-N6)-dimethyltransferase
MNKTGYIPCAPIVRQNLFPKRSLGQNFLIDHNIINNILNACAIEPGQPVVELGAGKGALTKGLLERGVKVFAVEIDYRFCRLLKETFASSKNFSLVETDMLSLDLSEFTHQGKITVVGNLPFNISSQVIARLLAQSRFIGRFFITIQKELAQRLVFKPASRQTNAFGLYVQFFSSPEILFTIKNTCFKPKPKVDAAFVQLHLRPQADTKSVDTTMLFNIIRCAFMFRRKTIINALAKNFTDNSIREALSFCRIDSQKRPEAITLEEYIRLANYLAPLEIGCL